MERGDDSIVLLKVQFSAVLAEKLLPFVTSNGAGALQRACSGGGLPPRAETSQCRPKRFSVLLPHRFYGVAGDRPLPQEFGPPSTFIASIQQLPTNALRFDLEVLHATIP